MMQTRSTKSARAQAAILAVAFFALAEGAAIAQTTPVPPPADPVTIARPPADPNTITVQPINPDAPPPPDGDARGPNERRRDRQAWDKCVRRAQRMESEIGQANPVADTPEEVCSRRLGMATRNSQPIRD